MDQEEELLCFGIFTLASLAWHKREDISSKEQVVT